MVWSYEDEVLCSIGSVFGGTSGPDVQCKSQERPFSNRYGKFSYTEHEMKFPDDS